MPNDDLVARLARLRSLGVHKGAQNLVAPATPRAQAGATALPGEEIETPFGPVWVRTEHYPLAGHPALIGVLEASPEALCALARDPALADAPPPQLVYLDTETTGLAPGTGTYVFLVGLGTYEAFDEYVGVNGRMPRAFVVRQFFMRHPGEERAMLYLVEQVLAGCAGVVTFNGRAFDVPLLHGRFLLAQAPPPLLHTPHLDLLPPARRIWRARLTSCALGELERSILGLQRTEEDIPGWLIPRVYQDYYRMGQGVDLVARVFYHNLQDVVSMALLAGRLTRLFEPKQLQQCLTELHPMDCASLARCYSALQWIEAGEAAYRTALARAHADAERTLVFRELGFMLKRLERRAEAASLWEEWITSISGDEVTPFVELAKYHEWHTGDLAAARGWTAWALRSLGGGPAGSLPDDTMTALQRRLERLERKLSGNSRPASADDDAGEGE